MQERGRYQNFESLKQAIESKPIQQRTEADSAFLMFCRMDTPEITTWLMDYQPNIWDMIGSDRIRRDELIILIYQIISKVVGIDRPTNGMNLQELKALVNEDRSAKSRLMLKIIREDIPGIETWLMDNYPNLYDQAANLSIKRRDHWLLWIYDHLS